MVLNGPTKTGKCPAIFENFNKNKKSLNPFIYKGFSDFYVMELLTGIGPVTPALPKLCSESKEFRSIS